MDERIKGVLLPYLPAEKILAAYRAAPGQELDSKFISQESSAALVANTFGLFLEAPALLPKIPGLEEISWPAQRVWIEKCLRFPWRGGHHPWLDAVIETEDHIIGVESKRYEPIRGADPAEFSAAYDRPVWGTKMRQFETLRDRLKAKPAHFHQLDAAQLIKHAFAIRTQSARQNKRGLLCYLYAEPAFWPDGRPVENVAVADHVKEVQEFKTLTFGAEVRFVACRYKELLGAMDSSPHSEVKRHAAELGKKYPQL